MCCFLSSTDSFQWLVGITGARMVCRMVCRPFGILESTLAVMKRKKSKVCGQAIALFAVLVPVTVLFFLGVVDYMVTNVRVMESVAAADLAAHAGAQQIRLLPDGSIESDPEQAQMVAAQYFAAQAPPEASLDGIRCGLIQERPACRVRVQVRSAGWLLPETTIAVTAVGYLAYGVTDGDQ
jgi:hypothetical protein